MFVIGTVTLICDIIDALRCRHGADRSKVTFRTVTEGLIETQVRYDGGPTRWT